MDHALVAVNRINYKFYSLLSDKKTIYIYVLGLRMGKMVSKIGLIMLMQKYDFECMKKGELEFDNHSVTLVLKGGINLKVSNRK